MAEESISENGRESQGFKKCPRCGENKPFSAFNKQTGKKHNLSSHCRSCQREAGKQYTLSHKIELEAYYQNHKKKIAEQRKRHYEANKIEILALRKQYRDTHKQERKEYYQKNKEKLKAYNIEYRKKNKQKVSERNRAYKQEHKDRAAEQQRQYYKTEAGRNTRIKKCHKRRVSKMGIGYENFNPIKVFQRDGYRCQMCGRKTRPDFNQWHPLYPHLDHIVPLSIGGEHSKANTQCLCRECNMAKGNHGNGDQMRLFG